jgi:hypothetical protein
MTTKRLPKGLKKQLEASLTSLTPKEGGKLYLLYVQEAARKGINPLAIVKGKHPPTKELEEAFRKKTDYTSELSVKQGNGFLFLSMLAFTVQGEAQDAIDALQRESTIAYERLFFMLTADQVTDVAREATEELARQPRPVLPEVYDQLLAWAENKTAFDLEELGDLITDAEEEEQSIGGEILELPFEDRRRLMQKRSRFPYLEDEECRRDWLAEQGEDQVLAQHFDGDRDRLEAWLVRGGFTDWKALDEFDSRRRPEWAARLNAAIEAGQLETIDQVALDGCHYGVAVTEGTIPAWAALRCVWPDWLKERQYRTYQQHFPRGVLPDYINNYRPAPLNVVYTFEGEVEGQQLVDLVGAFFEECRKRPWGDGLKADGIDFDSLARFLTAEASPLDYLDAPDLGTVDWLTFTESEDEDPTTYPAVLLPSLKAAADQLGLPEGMKLDWYAWNIRQDFYPTEYPALKDSTAKVISDRLATIRLDYPAFMYDEGSRWSPIFGEFKTPLQETIEWVGSLFGKLETLKLAIRLISEEFFDGLKKLEAALVSSENVLQGFLNRLEIYPWLVDVDRLKLTRYEADPSAALTKYVANSLITAWHIVDLGRVEAVDLGDGDFNGFKWLNEQIEALGESSLLEEGGASEEVSE